MNMCFLVWLAYLMTLPRDSIKSSLLILLVFEDAKQEKKMLLVAINAENLKDATVIVYQYQQL